MDHPFEKEVSQIRQSEYGIHPLILNRWSPRSMTGRPLTKKELMPLFEAASWAPSSYNNQPWHFLYALKGSSSWPLFFDVMIDFNKGWVQNAGAIVLVVSGKNFEHNGKFSRTHSFDTGAAWMALALEGAYRGYVVHGMEGFDYELAKKNLEIPDDYQIEALVAIGERAPVNKLPPELQKRELPSRRKKLTEILIEGKFKAPKKADAA